MIGIRIRTARSGEGRLLPQIERSAGRLFSQVESLAWIADVDDLPPVFHERLIADRTCWLAIGGSNVAVGFISAEAIGRTLHIWELSVAKLWQRRGIGTRLMEHVIGEATRRGMDEVTLTTFRNVPWNAPFYAGLGFQAVSECDERLEALLRTEEASGFEVETRCAMRLIIGHEACSSEPRSI